jgi:hypothetical protein
MQGSEFSLYLNKFPNFKNNFKGLYSIDQLPKTLKYRHFLITNTDVHTGKGIHWQIFFRTTSKEIELFDSCGVNDEKKNYMLKYIKFKQEIIFNETPFQQNDSSTCGFFVLFFAIHRLFNLDENFSDFLSEFLSNDSAVNQKQVSEFCSDILLDKY